MLAKSITNKTCYRECSSKHFAYLAFTLAEGAILFNSFAHSSIAEDDGV